jgi:competence protein ComEC
MAQTAPKPNPQASVKAEKPLSKQLRLPAFMPFFWLGMAAVAGPFLAQSFKPGYQVWLIGAAISLLGFIADLIHQTLQKSRRKLSIFLVLATVCLSAMLYSLSLPKNTAQYINYYNDKGTVNLTGMVIKPPRQNRNAIDLTLRVESINALQLDQSAQSLRGYLLVQVPIGSDYAYGDRISVYGELTQPPEGSSFSYREYLFHKGVYAMNQFGSVRLLSRANGNWLFRGLYKLRARSAQVLQNNFPNPESALLRGILLGDESGLSKDLSESYARTGTSHIIAISGFNMAVLAGVVSMLLRRRMGRMRGSIVAITVLLLYTIFVGGNAAVTRAFVMSAFAIFGSSIARRGNLLNSLGLSVFLMVLIDPHLPWDIGFQFSVMATLALSLFATPLQAWVEDKLQSRISEERARSIAAILSEYFLITLIAQVLVLPLIIYHFRQISWLFLLANPLILPVQPLVMILGLIALIGGLFSVALGQFLSWLSWPFVAYTNMVVQFLAGLAPKTWQLPEFSAIWLAVYYVLLYFVVFRPRFKSNNTAFWQPAFALLGMASLCIVFATHLSAKPDGKLSLRVLGKNETPVVLIRVPRGDYVLSGGGSDAQSLTEQVSKALPPFNQEIAYLLIPACKKADLNGFHSLAHQVNIAEVLWACDPESSRSAQSLYSVFETKTIPQRQLSQDDLLSWDSGEISFVLNDIGLQGISVEDEGFIAQISYAPAPHFGQTEDLSVWIGEAKHASQCAQVMLATTLGKPANLEDCPAEFVSVLEHDWLQISSDGKQLWLSKR